MQQVAVYDPFEEELLIIRHRNKLTTLTCALRKKHALNVEALREKLKEVVLWGILKRECYDELPRKIKKRGIKQA
jgi:DNA-binding HxlR family transcriptional regulator